MIVITAFIFEIPTGAIADTYGRKTSMVLGLIIIGLVFLLIPIANSFFVLLILFFIYGLFVTFRSGADTAWVVDYLKHKKSANLIQDYFIKFSIIGSTGSVIGALLNSLFVRLIGLNVLWYFAGSGTILGSLILLIFGKEHFERKKVHIKESISNVLNNSKKSIRYGIKHPVIFYLILSTLFAVFASDMGGIAWQPFMKISRIPIHWFGIIFAIGSSLTIMGPLFVKPLLKKLREKYALALLGFFDVLILLAFYFIFGPILAALITILSFMPESIAAPIYQSYFHKHVPSKIRATVKSLDNMVACGASAGGLLVAGLLVDSIGARITIVISGFFLIPAIIAYLRIKK